MKKCTACGSDVPKEARFCQVCGNSDFIFPNTQQEERINSSQEQCQLTDFPNGWQPPVPQKKEQIKKIGLVVVSVVIVLLALVGIGIAVNNTSQKEENKYSGKSYIEKDSDLDTEVADKSEVLEETETIDESQEVDKSEGVDEPQIQKPTENTTVTETPVPADIPYDETEMHRAVSEYESYRNYGIFCEFDHGEMVYGEAWEYMTPAQQAVAYDLLTCSCCTSIQEAKNHRSKYFASSMNASIDPFLLVEYRGILYCIINKDTHFTFDNNDLKIARTAYNKFSVTARRYGSLDFSFKGYTQMDFEYQNGTYKIVKAIDY